VSLLLGKVYQVLRPQPKDWPTWLRVVDEDGEDYLYPADRFVEVDLPNKARPAIAKSVTGSV